MIKKTSCVNVWQEVFFIVAKRKKIFYGVAKQKERLCRI